MSTLPRITRAAAEFLAEAQEYHAVGMTVSTLDERAIARELENECFGRVHLECDVHGRIRSGECTTVSHEITQVFMINDYGTEWLADAGKLV